MSRADLGGADLTGTNLNRPNLAGANLYEANLTKSDLYRANLTGAKLNRANLTKARRLTQAQLDTAFGNPLTGLPTELRRPEHWMPTGA